MGKNNGIPLSQFSLPLKVLITCFIFTLMVGYLVAFVQIYDRTHFNVAQTLLYYRGDESSGTSAILLPQSFRSLLSVAHVHSFSQPVMLALMGLPFVFSSVGEKSKIFFILLSFLGSLVSNAAPWLIRYGSHGMVALLPISQAALLISLLFMTFVVLYDLWCRKKISIETPS